MKARAAVRVSPRVGRANARPIRTMAMLAQKKAARQALKSALKQLSPATMAEESKAICSAVLGTKLFHQAKTLALYIHCARLLEVDTTALLQAALSAGKRVYVPLVQDKASNMQLLHLDDMAALVAAPPYGILEPSTTYADGSPREDALTAGTTLDLLLMPGLGFDLTGNRLGRGGGYYDKAVSTLKRCAQEQNKPAPLIVALAYSAQVLPEVPTDSHDERVDVVVTPQGAHGCTDRGKDLLNA